MIQFDWTFSGVDFVTSIVGGMLGAWLMWYLFKDRIQHRTIFQDCVFDKSAKREKEG